MRPTLVATLGLAVLGLGCQSPAAEPAPASAAPASARPGPLSQAPPGFWERWGDGQAELSGYALTQPRYGELRHGEAVLVVVREDFTLAQRVKSDGGHDDEYPVLKLNEVRDFQTGIYDYNLLTSTFLPLGGQTPRGLPTKLSMSMQEWCGSATEQLLFDLGRGGALSARRSRHSYFDGEGDQQDTVALPAGTVAADGLPLLVRGLVGELTPPGGTAQVQLLPRLTDLRLQHRPLEIQSASLARAATPTTVTVPAGTFSVETWTLRAGDKLSHYQVELAPPHRLVAWDRSDGEAGQLTGSRRGAYWTEHSEGDEALRAELGLPAHTWPQP